MGKLIILISCIFLASCKILPPRLETQKAEIPIMYVPSPPHMKKLQLAYFNLTEDQLNDDGEVAKALRIDFINLVTYHKIFVKILHEMEKMAATNPDFDGLNEEDKKKVRTFGDKLKEAIDVLGS